MKVRIGRLAVLVAFALAVTPLWAGNYTGVGDYSARDIPSDYFSGFDVTANGKFVGLVGQDIKLYSADGVYERTIGSVPDYSASTEWGSFCRLSPDESQVWAGFTIGGNTDDRIYNVSFAGGTPVHQATLPGCFDLEFRQVASAWKPFVSGLGVAGSWDNAVWMLDTVADNHMKIVDIGGYSAGIAFDSAGNLFGAHAVNKVLYKWTATNIDNAIAAEDGSTPMTTVDASWSTEIDGGPYDIAIDGADNVYFSANGGSTVFSFVALVDMDKAGTYKYDHVAHGSGSYGNWATLLAVGNGATDIDAGEGALYVGDFYYSGASQLAVPEPMTLTMLAMGVMGLFGMRRNRRS